MNSAENDGPVHRLNNGVAIHRFAPEHAEGLRRLRNQDHVRHGFRDDSVISEAQQASWVADYLTRTDDHLWVALDASGEVVAAAALYDFDRTAGDAQLGRVMFDRQRTDLRGTGSMVVDWVTRQASNWGLDRVWLFVKNDNAPAIAAYLRCGYMPNDQRSEAGMIYMVRNLDG